MHWAPQIVYPVLLPSPWVLMGWWLLTNKVCRSDSIWHPSLSYKRWCGFYFVHWYNHPWKLQPPCCEKDQTSLCRETTWKGPKSIWRERCLANPSCSSRQLTTTAWQNLRQDCPAKPIPNMEPQKLREIIKWSIVLVLRNLSFGEWLIL